MITKGSIVHLRGHERVKMVVLFTSATDGTYTPPGHDKPPHDRARVAWLDRQDRPQAETYSMDVLVEADGETANG